MEEQLIFEIWDTFRDHIPEKGRESAADQFVEFLLGNDVDIETFEGLLGYDPHLDAAVELVLEELRNTGEEEEEDYSDEEEEDY
jgi:hypothetical protein